MGSDSNRCLQLADFVVNLDFQDIPKEVIAKEKDHLLDGLGNGLYGAVSSFGVLVRQYLERFPTSGESVVWGTPSKVNCLQAAFANGSFANLTEMEDAHHRTKFKPNTVLVPAALAVAEKTGASGAEVLTALVVANEICLRIATATHVGKEGYARGWISTSSIGTFGAAAITGKLLGLSVEQMAHALSLAGSQPTGLWCGGLAMSKRVLIGKAAENGIAAAFMAAEGITGGFDIFDGKWGNIGDIISPVYEPEFLTKDLGSYWMTMEIGLKCYPTKGGVHSAIDAVLDILRKEPLAPQEIEDILVRTTTGIATNKALHHFPPTDFYEAQNSMGYILAVTIFDRACGLKQFTEEKYRDPEILELGKKVRIVPEPEADKLAPKTKTTFVDITLKDGRQLTSRVDYCSGEPENPLTREQLEAKFKEVASAALDDKAMAEVIRTVGQLETLSNLRELTNLLIVA
ncbi:MmgE/PrpD family protein [Neomoorella glycerini]|uniref:MmgE/PrpD family protein n=1 Tax=Neomoorella glycerini TaxID=55779 RepID=A0A6I5ZM88_9FIRM|nr:MmgE/PrpD family protein [Moorella glycerini]QGP90994.1 MmgE/PrpD family protein [Moorella glycerini]